MSNPVYYYGEIKVQPPMSEEHAQLVEDVVNMKDSAGSRSVISAIQASDAPDLPYYGGQLYVSDDRTTIHPEDGESRHGLRLWLLLLLRHFFVPQGYTLDGEISFEASDDVEDRGTIYIRSNKLETTDVMLFGPGPSWEPNHYVDPVLKQTIQALLDSADATGCTPNLTVVSSHALKKVRDLMARAV